jgi:ferredoxin
MRVRVDSSRCEGYGTCSAILPELFKLDEWGIAYVEGDGTVPPQHEDAARRAVFECPMSALSFED